MDKFRIKPGNKCVTKTFRFPTNLIADLDKIAKDNHLPLNNFVIQCIRYALDNLNESTDYPA